MRSKAQQQAREWSRMHPVDRAVSKGILRGDQAGGQVAGLVLIVHKALEAGERVRQKRKEARG